MAKVKMLETSDEIYGHQQRANGHFQMAAMLYEETNQVLRHALEVLTTRKYLKPVDKAAIRKVLKWKPANPWKGWPVVPPILIHVPDPKLIKEDKPYLCNIGDKFEIGTFVLAAPAGDWWFRSTDGPDKDIRDIDLEEIYEMIDVKRMVRVKP